MKKSTLYVIGDILNSLDTRSRNLYELLDTMNLSPDEKERVLESIYVIVEKLEQIKRSKINELGNYIDIEQVEKISRY